jgi:hypothetical protein
MRAVAGTLGVVLCAVLLASCGLVPFGGSSIRDDRQALDDRMEQIVEALDVHDADALKAMFSPHALAEAPDIDGGLEYLFSLFPDGGLTWKYTSSGFEGDRSGGRHTDLWVANYDVSVGGNEFRFFFADFTVNRTEPDNVGIYAIGAAPATDQLFIGPSGLFRAWSGSMHVDERGEMAYPGVYVPDFDNPNVSGYVIRGIVEELESGDDVGLAERFSSYARSSVGVELEPEADALLAQFPGGDVEWDESQAVSVVRYGPEEEGETVLLLSRYPVISGGRDFWIAFAHFSINSADHSKEGIYAIGLAARTESGDSLQEQALFAWIDSFDVTASTPPGILISE